VCISWCGLYNDAVSTTAVVSRGKRRYSDRELRRKCLWRVEGTVLKFFRKDSGTGLYLGQLLYRPRCEVGTFEKFSLLHGTQSGF
jgi:hypothetical protein